MGDVLQIKPCANVALALRNIADSIDAGDINGESCTLILGADVFYLGEFDDGKAAVGAIWDMTYGIHKLMSAATV